MQCEFVSHSLVSLPYIGLYTLENEPREMGYIWRFSVPHLSRLDSVQLCLVPNLLGG